MSPSMSLLHFGPGLELDQSIQKSNHHLLIKDWWIHQHELDCYLLIHSQKFFTLMFHRSSEILREDHTLNIFCLPLNGQILPL
ncbi:hypothetical protein NC651_009704 [Populus alba x Populus x berolinensis]|nr:hypothetical protein NC651_009704 [Populus alba x Populus x berolinensis]